MPQPYDIQLPDILGQYQRGKDMAFQNERRPIEAAQNDQAFAYKDQAAKTKQIAQRARFLAGLSPQARPAAYAAMRGELDPIGQSLGLPPLPAAWDETHLGELQQLSMLDQGNDQSNIPADIQTMEYYKSHPDQFDRQIKLRQASANPFGFQTITGADGVERLVQTNKREGGAAEIGPGGVPQGMGAGPMGVPPMGGGDFATEATAIAQKHGFRPTSIARSQAENSRLPGASANSRHLSGNAIDVSIRGKSPQELAALDADMTAAGFKGGIHLEGSFPHMHYSRDPGASAGPNPYASRPAEQQAGLNAGAAESAKIAAQVGATSAVAGSEAEIARQKALAETKAKGQGERENSLADRSQKAVTALDLLVDAEALLPNATGSGLGAARDATAAFFGKSTDGAKAAADLHRIAGQLVLMQPRMEGPQSDADRKLYAQMAGDLGNESIPVATRMAALKGMQKLQQKYANKQVPNGAPNITTQAQYDALPKGAVYMEDGKQYRKP